MSAQVKADRPFRRTTNSLSKWLIQAEKDFAFLGRLERLQSCDAELLASLARADPLNRLQLLEKLADIVSRCVAVVDAATEFHHLLAGAVAAANRPATARD